jgi:hypothetical protein
MMVAAKRRSSVDPLDQIRAAGIRIYAVSIAR